MQSDAYDEIQQYIDETLASDRMRTEIVRLWYLLQRCEEMPFHYQSVFAKWLREVRQELCHIEDSFDPVFIRKELAQELMAFERWILPYISTEKIAVPQERLRLSSFVYHRDDTDKTAAITKLDIQKNNGNIVT
jgi:hypothetical protein